MTTQAAAEASPPWFEIAKAYERMGILEVPGKEAHPMIKKFFTQTSLKRTKLALSDETAWCSAFACACMEEAGYRSPRSAAARSWKEWGYLTVPRPGCVVVFDRSDPANPNAAHVGFLFGLRADDKLDVLGGNQRNRVCVAPYERAKVLSYRWPVRA